MSLYPATDTRFIALTQWLTTLSALQPHYQLKLDSLCLASADASFRRYFRVDTQQGESLIVMDAPPPQENVGRFIQVGERLATAGVSVPAILAQDIDNGFLLITDFGHTDYSHALSHDSAHNLYLDAIDAIVLMQSQAPTEGLPEYDRAFFLREMMLFPQWYIGTHLGVTLTDEQTTILNTAFEAILANTLAQPQVFVHRDFHSRNLMVLEKGNPGVLDFQDAVYGPITYDLVSLLRDAYVQWDEEMVLDWAIRYWERAKRAGLPVNADIDAFYRDFEFMGIQRHLKIMGLFARLHHRDGKDAYLKAMPLVMEYIRRAAKRYIALIPFGRLIDELEGTASQIGYTF